MKLFVAPKVILVWGEAGVSVYCNEDINLELLKEPLRILSMSVDLEVEGLAWQVEEVGLTLFTAEPEQMKADLEFDFGLAFIIPLPLHILVVLAAFTFLFQVSSLFA